jgi:Tol biopolymer transport system component
VGQGLGAQQLSWSPDSTRLAFIAEPRDSTGTPVSILDLTTGKVTHLPAADGYLWDQVAWSPDGGKIALAGNEAFPDSSQDNTDDIYLLPLDGGPLTRIKTDVPTEFMDWSPDGKQLALSVHNGPWPEDRGDYRWGIAIMNADGSGFTQLTDRLGWDNFPVWSPDGQWIAFSSDRGASEAQLEANRSPDATTFGGVGIYVMRPDGTDVQPVLVAGDGNAVITTSWKA